jgi:hypothetical protein
MSPVVLLNPKRVRTRKSPTLAVHASRGRDKVKTLQLSRCLHFDCYVLNHKHSGMEAFRVLLYWIVGNKVLQLHEALLPVGHPDVSKVLLVRRVHAQHQNVSISQYGKTWRCPCV